MDDISGGAGGLGHEIDLGQDDDDIFKSARIEPEPEKQRNGSVFSTASDTLFDDDRGPSEDRDIPLEDDDERPFQVSNN